VAEAAKRSTADSSQCVIPGVLAAACCPLSPLTLPAAILLMAVAVTARLSHRQRLPALVCIGHPLLHLQAARAMLLRLLRLVVIARRPRQLNLPRSSCSMRSVCIAVLVTTDSSMTRQVSA
jgi:hypothetical protein